MQKIVELEGLGTVVLRKNKRSKRLMIRLQPMREIIVTMPSHVTYDRAINYVQSKTDWIISNRQKIKEIENERTVFDTNSKFPGKFHEFVFRRAHNTKATDCHIKNGKIFFRVSPYMDIYTDEFQAFIRKCIDNALEIEAYDYLVERVFELSAEHRISFSDLRFTRAKTRWGSCSSQNRISLNIHLMRLPHHLIDYVIIHELVHTIEKNHSKEYWSLLEQYLPGAKKLDKELNKYKIEIY